MSRFTNQKEQDICNFYKSGINSLVLGERFNCHFSTICRIVAKHNIARRPGQPRKVFRENFSSKYKKISNGCWVWQAAINKVTGYGTFSTYIESVKKTHLAHRFSYELYVGKIPKDFTIDHLCRNRVCVNPDHLEVTTLKENILRGNGVAAVNARKTHCLHGHQLSGNNCYIDSKGGRVCKICCVNRSKKYIEKKNKSFV